VTDRFKKSCWLYFDATIFLFKIKMVQILNKLIKLRSYDDTLILSISTISKLQV